MTETTPEYGFPLPSDQSRISAFPWHLRALSRALEDKLPGAVSAAAGKVTSGEVARYSAAVKAAADVARTTATAALDTARDASTRIKAAADDMAAARAASDSATTTAADAMSLATATAAGAGMGPGGVTDGAVASVLSQAATQTAAAVNAVISDRTGGRRVTATERRFGTPYSRQAVLNAIDYAESLGHGTVVYLPSGTYNLGTGISLAGKSVQLQGDGAFSVWDGSPTSTQAGTVLHAPDQTGPVLDFRGWIAPHAFLGKMSHGGFLIVGSGKSDKTNTRNGMRFNAISSCHFHDIGVRSTGGSGLYGEASPGNAVYLNFFSRVVVESPVDAELNDVPYYYFNEANGNVFSNVAFRSIRADNDCGKSGAFVLASNATYPAYGNTFRDAFVEYMHVPEGGTVWDITGHSNAFHDTVYHDVVIKGTGAGASMMRFKDSALTETKFGGNIVTGRIPGCDTAGSQAVGIDLRQSYNTVHGVKGYPGRNVRLAPGVGFTHVALTGSLAQAIDAAFVNESGTTTNALIDHVAGTSTASGVTTDYGGARTGPRFMSATSPTDGAVKLGNADTRLEAVGRRAFMTADALQLRTAEFENAMELDVGEFPGIRLPDNPKGLGPTVDGWRGRLAFIKGGAGKADRVVACLKNADGSITWRDLA